MFRVIYLFTSGFVGVRLEDILAIRVLFWAFSIFISVRKDVLLRRLIHLLVLLLYDSIKMFYGSDFLRSFGLIRTFFLIIRIILMFFSYLLIQRGSFILQVTFQEDFVFRWAYISQIIGLLGWVLSSKFQGRYYRSISLVTHSRRRVPWYDFMTFIDFFSSQRFPSDNLSAILLISIFIIAILADHSDLFFIKTHFFPANLRYFMLQCYSGWSSKVLRSFLLWYWVRFTSFCIDWP